jgi:2-keto-4-pentenoate hydratase/2-oxohepta-3-ene-1,7-dioic acid hydratase in catechol pathway
MKLATFTHRERRRIGVVTDAGIIDLSEAAPALPTEMVAFLESGESAMQQARRAGHEGTPIPLADVHIDAPLLRPPKFIAIGLNYADHVAETGIDTPVHPMIFNKQSTCVVGPTDPVHIPRASAVVDYEGEFAFVIGRRCRHVSREDAAGVIAGYCIANDVTVRDWQLRVPTWTIGKSFDTHGPIGPWIVTPDEIGDPHQLRLRTFVNDELRQDSNTKHLIFDCYTLVEHLSTAFTLEPGDVISTGTPGGIGIAMKPPKLLQNGDVVRIEIEGIGRIENPVIDEPTDTPFIA